MAVARVWNSSKLFYFNMEPRLKMPVLQRLVSICTNLMCLLRWFAPGRHDSRLHFLLLLLGGTTVPGHWRRRFLRSAVHFASVHLLLWMAWGRSFIHMLSLLWPPYVIGQAIIFLPCGFFLSSIYLSFFIPRLITAVTDWMSTILWHMVWP